MPEATVRDIEAAFVAHWSLLGRWPGAQLLDKGGILRYETPSCVFRTTE